MPTQSKSANLELASVLRSARANTDALFELVRPDALYERPIPERHRIVFYIGHLEAFDWNLICQRFFDVPSFQAEFDKLFAFGIDPGSGNLPQDKPADWPGLTEIGVYNVRVREKVDQLVAEAPEQLLHVAIEHRLMHAETFAYMLHNLANGQKLAPPSTPRPEGGPVQPRMLPVPGGAVALGLRPGERFGWDNEFQRHSVEVALFEIGKYKVTNGEYLAFVNEGAPPPHFWTSRSGRWFYRGMFEEIPLPLEWPVYVSRDQAAAYAAWMGKRLPTEAEYQLAAFGSDGDGLAGLNPARENYDFQGWDPVPVNSSQENRYGFAQLVGNGWEWTDTVFQPFPGFAPFPFYPGYSADFFDGQHYVLKGASPRTAARLVRPSFRNWFRGSYPYADATFRLAGN